MPTYDPNSLKGYTMIHGEESYGSKGSFGLKIFIKDEDREKLNLPVNRHGKKETYNTDGDYMHVFNAVKALKIGLRGETEKLKPDFAAKRAKEKAYYRQLFTDAGIETVYMQELPNGYCPEGGWCCLNKPWFKVTTPFGHVQIGWRKSVINIDWTESDVWQSGEQLFPKENVTKGGGYAGDRNNFIHAHGKEKAVEYLKALKEGALIPQPVKKDDE